MFGRRNRARLDLLFLGVCMFLGLESVRISHAVHGPGPALGQALQMSAASQPGGPAPAVTTPWDRARIQKSYSRIPLCFEANQGQTDGRIQFLSRGSGYALFLTSTEAVLCLQKAAVICPGTAADDRPLAGTVLRMQVLGSNAGAAVAGLEQLPGKVNYLLGNDPHKWRTNVATYARVNYSEVYPGIDLTYYGNQQQLEYDFVVSPGADPSAITLGFNGAERVDLDARATSCCTAPASPSRSTSLSPIRR